MPSEAACKKSLHVSASSSQAPAECDSSCSAVQTSLVDDDRPPYHRGHASGQEDKTANPSRTWFQSCKCLVVRYLRSCGQESKRKLRNLYIYASSYTYASSLYIRDTALRVKVRESLGHLGQWLYKYLIINYLSVDKKWTRRGFASWTSWTAVLISASLIPASLIPAVLIPAVLTVTKVIYNVYILHSIIGVLWEQQSLRTLFVLGSSSSSPQPPHSQGVGRGR